MKTKKWFLISGSTLIIIVFFMIISGRALHNTVIDNVSRAYDLHIQFTIIGLTLILLILLTIIFLLSRSNLKLRRTEESLRESEELLLTVINSLPDIICFKDAEGRWIKANNAMLSLYNTRRPILGKTDKELSSLIPEFKDEFKACEETDNRVWERAETTMVEEAFHQPDGSLRTFEVAKVPLFHDNGSRKGLVVLGREITERKKEEALRKEAEKSNRLVNELRQYDKIRTEFFANISHELRTPLNLILSPIQLIELMNRNTSLEDNHEKLENYIATIKQNCYRLIRIVTNLIDITKIDSGCLETNFRKVNIVQLIEDVTLSAKGYMENKDIDIVFDTDFEEKFLYCDTDKIERIMLNLLSNSAKFTERGGYIKVDMTDMGDSIQISLKDTGIGIPKDRQAAVFERFVQVDKSLSRSSEGSGIGLSLVKAFIELHGGTVAINSEYKQGTEFIINLPSDILPIENIEGTESFNSDYTYRTDAVNIEFSDIYS